MKPDELDLLLGGISLSGLLLASYGLGTKHKGTILLGSTIFLVAFVWSGKHGSCQECRNRWTQWKRKLGRQLIE